MRRARKELSPREIIARRSAKTAAKNDARRMAELAQKPLVGAPANMVRLRQLHRAFIGIRLLDLILDETDEVRS